MLMEIHRNYLLAYFVLCVLSYLEIIWKDIMIDYLRKASVAYYAGNPIIDDDTFDVLVERYPLDEVGCKEGEAKHFKQLYSLNKVYDIDDIKLDISQCAKTPKLDGSAISLLYIDGVFTQAITRGDGKVGQDVTANVAYLVPKTIDIAGIAFIVGEVVVPVELDIDNKRNYAAGSINLNDTEEFTLRLGNLYFIAYSLESTEWKSLFFTDGLKHLSIFGFETVLSYKLEDRFLTDGWVYRLYDNEEYEELGYTAKFPRGAIALKSREAAETKETEIMDIIWQLGGSGALTPVALLYPLVLEDATISRATLHNAGFIEDMGIEIGSKVLVQRAGHIIPKIIGLVE